MTTLLEHLEAHLGPCKHVMHGLGGGVHVRIHAPTRRRKHFTFVTVGLSRHRMPVPGTMSGAEDKRHAELLAYLPSDAQLPTAAGLTPSYWPFAVLTALAAVMRQQQTYIHEHQFLPMFAPPERFGLPGCKVTDVMLDEPAAESRAFSELRVEGRLTRFIHVLPITNAERAVGETFGAAALGCYRRSGEIPDWFAPGRDDAITLTAYASDAARCWHDEFGEVMRFIGDESWVVAARKYMRCGRRVNALKEAADAMGWTIAKSTRFIEGMI